MSSRPAQGHTRGSGGPTRGSGGPTRAQVGERRCAGPSSRPGRSTAPLAPLRRPPRQPKRKRALPVATRAGGARGGAPGPSTGTGSRTNDPRRGQDHRRARSGGGERRRGHRSRRRRERSWARRRRAAAADDDPGDAGGRGDLPHGPGDVVLGDPTLKGVAGDPEESRGTDDGAALVESFDAERPLDRLEIERFNGEAHAKDTTRGPVSRSDHAAPAGHARPRMICSRASAEKSRGAVNISAIAVLAPLQAREPRSPGEASSRWCLQPPFWARGSSERRTPSPRSTRVRRPSTLPRSWTPPPAR